VRLSRTSFPVPTDGSPILVVLNHPSWWDPLLCVSLLPLFPGYTHYAAIEAEAVRKYRVFTRLGFFPVDTKSLQGAAEFLRIGEAILSAPKRAVWVTAQGDFADVRKRPLDLKRGVGHLAARLSAGWVVPVALEYSFWNERTPEALIRIGEAIRIEPSAGARAGRVWAERIEVALATTLDRLNMETQSRDPARFRELIGGSTGAGGMYDGWRRFTAWIRGRRFDPSHGGPNPENPA